MHSSSGSVDAATVSQDASFFTANDAVSSEKGKVLRGSLTGKTGSPVCESPRAASAAAETHSYVEKTPAVLRLCASMKRQRFFGDAEVKDPPPYTSSLNNGPWPPLPDSYTPSSASMTRRHDVVFPGSQRHSVGMAQDATGSASTYSSHPSSPRALSVASSGFRYWRHDASHSSRHGGSTREANHAAELEIAAVRQEAIEFRRQNEILRQETRSLQHDNVVLLSQLEDQTACLGALMFDAERYKTALEQEGIDVPKSTFFDVRTATKIPRTATHSGRPLPKDLVEAAQLTEEEAASFSSIQGLVNTVNELQVRVREAHLRRISVADDRVAELQQLVTTVESQLEEVQRSRESMRERFNEDLLNMTRKKDAAVGRLGVLEAEVKELTKELQAAKACEALQIEELKLGELEVKVDSLQELLEERSCELNTLRTERNSLLAASVVSQKENEYYTTALKRERDQNEDLRRERDALNDELNALRTSYATSSTNVLLLEGKQELADRVAAAKEAEIQQWKKRSQELQQQHAEELAYWDKSVHEAVARLSKTEVKLEAAQEQVVSLETALAAKEQKAAASLAEKDECVASLTSRLKQSQALLEEEVASRTVSQRRVTELEIALKNQKEERKVLVDRIALVEKQAIVLKERHPALDFEVFEEEIQRFEGERRAVLGDLNTLQQEKAELARHLAAREAHIKEVEATVDQQHKRLEEKTEELCRIQAQCDTHAAERASEMERLRDAQEALTEHKALLERNKRQLDQSNAERAALESQMNTLKEQFETEKNLYQKEMEDLKRRLDLELSDTETVRQAHRLGVQAHSRDLQRIDTLTQEIQALRAGQDVALEEEKRRTTQVRSELTAAETSLSTLRGQLQRVEAEKELLKTDNESMRTLMNEKLDALELENPEALKTQLASRLRTEEALKRALDASRVDVERLKLELNAIQGTVVHFQSQTQNDAVLLEKLRAELELARGTQSDSRNSPDREQELLLLQMRFDRLTKDHQYQQELRRNSEKQLNTVLAETEPLRRREALLQGEIVSLKNSLGYAKQDVESYKSKYFAAVKGQESALDTQKQELGKQISALETDKGKLQDKLAVLTHQLQQAVAARDAAKADHQKTCSEVSSLRNQTTSLQTEIQGLKASAQKQQQQQKATRTDNPDIQRRYQLQLSNLQRLLQQLNLEKEALRVDLSQSTEELQKQRGITERMAQELDQLRVELSLVQQGSQIPAGRLESSVSPVTGEPDRTTSVSDSEAHLRNLVSDMADDVVRLGVLSAVLAKASDLREDESSPYDCRGRAGTGACPLTFGTENSSSVVYSLPPISNSLGQASSQKDAVAEVGDASNTSDGRTVSGKDLCTADKTAPLVSPAVDHHNTLSVVNQSSHPLQEVASSSVMSSTVPVASSVGSGQSSSPRGLVQPLSGTNNTENVLQHGEGFQSTASAVSILGNELGVSTYPPPPSSNNSSTTALCSIVRMEDGFPAHLQVTSSVVSDSLAVMSESACYERNRTLVVSDVTDTKKEGMDCDSMARESKAAPQPSLKNYSSLPQSSVNPLKTDIPKIQNEPEAISAPGNLNPVDAIQGANGSHIPPATDAVVAPVFGQQLSGEQIQEYTGHDENHMAKVSATPKQEVQFGELPDTSRLAEAPGEQHALVLAKEEPDVTIVDLLEANPPIDVTMADNPDTAAQ